MSNKIHSEFTSTIVEALTSGELPPWRRPWVCDANAPGLHSSLSSGRPYRGINQLLLMVAAMKQSFRSKWFGTFKQIQNSGGRILKGSKATTIVLYRPVECTKIDSSGEEVDDSFCVMRRFKVFNADQTDLTQFQVNNVDALSVPFELYESAEGLIDGVGADIRYGGSEAFYQPQDDYIQLPNRSRFATAAAFYETAFHELVHYTEHADRLNWDRAEHGYAKGELVAELGACFMMAELGLPDTNNLTNHAAYLKHWLKGMEDPKFIFNAASQASKAVAWLMERSGQATEFRESTIAL